MTDQWDWNNTDSMEDNSDWNTLDPIPLVHLLEESTFESPQANEEEIVSIFFDFGVAEDGRHFMTLIVEYRHHITRSIYRIFLD